MHEHAYEYIMYVCGRHGTIGICRHHIRLQGGFSSVASKPEARFQDLERRGIAILHRQALEIEARVDSSGASKGTKGP